MVPSPKIHVRPLVARLLVPLLTDPSESRIRSDSSLRELSTVRFETIRVDYSGILIQRSRHRAERIRQVVNPSASSGLLADDLAVHRVVFGDGHGCLLGMALSQTVRAFSFPNCRAEYRKAQKVADQAQQDCHG